MSSKVLVSYDLIATSNYGAFKEELESMLYDFSIGDNELPNTTCIASFEDDVSISKALDIVKKDMRRAQENVLRHSKCKITNVVIISYESKYSLIGNSI